MNSAFDPARRRLLRGNLRRQPEAIRPPWSLVGQRFLDACARSGDCIDACPEAILMRGDGGYPEVDFRRGACTFCGECARACTLSLFGPTDARPWGRTAEVGGDCLPRRGVVCRSCADTCEPGAIDFHPRLGAAAVPTINYALCTGCGGCIAACPTAAITLTAEE